MPRPPGSFDDDPPFGRHGSSNPAEGVSTVRVPAPFPPPRTGTTKLGPEADPADGALEPIPPAVKTRIGGVGPTAALPDGEAQREAGPAEDGEGFGQHKAFHAGRAYPDLPAATPYTFERARPEPAPPVRMNKWSYRLTIYGCTVLSAVLAAWGASDRAVQELLVVSWIPVVPAVVMQFVLVYKMWASIQDGLARTSPGKAVGLTFVPLFNLYWLFEVFPGFATDYNGYLKRHGIQAPPLSRGLVLATLLLPGIGVLLYWVLIGKICDAVNALSAN